MKAIYFMSPTAKVFILSYNVEHDSQQNEIYVLFCFHTHNISNLFDCCLINMLHLAVCGGLYQGL